MSSACTTAAISSQRALPVYICARVRGCSASTLAPASWQRSAISTGLRISSLQPLRIFTVTGRCVPARTALITPVTSPMSLRQPEPPLRFTTFLTGQPKLMSMNSGAKTSVTRRRGLAHGGGVGAEDLHADGALVVPEAELGDRGLVLAADALGREEFRDDHVRAPAAAEAPEGRLRNAGHGREVEGHLVGGRERETEHGEG